MGKKLFLGSFWLVFLAVFTVAETTALPWSYDGDTGPDRWGRLDPSFELCKEGDSQSPITIQDVVLESNTLSPDSFYQLGPFALLNSQYHIGFLPLGAQVLKFQARDYVLKAIRVHTPAEHRVLDHSFPMSLQLHHQTASGEKLVLVLLFVHGTEDAVELAPLISLLTHYGPQAKQEAFNPNDLLPEKRRYYRYSGSMTTPPCDEELQWLIVNQPISISQKSFIEFKKAKNFKNNNRPIQAGNRRPIGLL